MSIGWGAGSESFGSGAVGMVGDTGVVALCAGRVECKELLKELGLG